MTHTTARPVALVTGASRGLGRALADDLVTDGWHVVVDARHPDGLPAEGPSITRVVGDITDPAHRRDLAAAVADLGGLDLVVNNAGILGPSPQPPLLEYPLDVLDTVLRVNVIAALAVLQEVRGLLRPGARVVSVSSDAGVEPIAGWGGYGASKAALDHLSAVLALEDPDVRHYAVDPGDMRTAMHQAAFPGEDIGDRADPATVVPAFRVLARGDLPSGRYRAADLAVVR